MSISNSLEVTAVDPAQGSIAGGTEVTLTGKGFGKDKDQVNHIPSNSVLEDMCGQVNVPSTIPCYQKPSGCNSLLHWYQSCKHVHAYR